MTRRTLGRLALLAPLGAFLFTLAWFVLGLVSPGYRLFDLVIEPYSPISQPISGLGLGVTGPWMNAAFVIGGALVFTGTLGATTLVPRTGFARVALALVSLVGVGMIVDGLFTLESVMLHLAGFLLAVPLPAVGFVLAGIVLRRIRPLIATWLVVAGSAALVLFAVFMVIFDPYTAGSGEGVAGLVQRVLVTLVLATISMVGLAAFSGRRVVEA